MSLIKHVRKLLAKRLWFAERGSITVELALATPVFLGVFSGVVEVGHYMHLNMKLQHTAIAVTDLVTRDDELSESVLIDIFNAVPSIMSPYYQDQRLRTVVTAIGREEGDIARTIWQRQSGSYTGGSSDYVGVGAAATLPDPIILEERQTVLVTEIFYDYEPLIFPVVDASTLKKVSIYRPRLGALDEVIDN